MAKSYRTEREILTIEVPVDIPTEQLSEKVSPEKSQVLKISAYPAVWRWLQDNLDDRQLIIDTLIDRAIWDAYNKMPRKLIKKKDLTQNDFDSAFDCYADIEERKIKGKYHRGLNKLKHPFTDEIHEKAPWIHWFFRFWKTRKQQRPVNVQLIYDERRKRFNRATSDPTAMTYFCCQFFYEEKYHNLGQTFPEQESFRTRYLTPSVRKRLKVEEVIQLTENRRHPLNIIAEICRKLQE